MRETLLCLSKEFHFLWLSFTTHTYLYKIYISILVKTKKAISPEWLNRSNGHFRHLDICKFVYTYYSL